MNDLFQGATILYFPLKFESFFYLKKPNSINVYIKTKTNTKINTINAFRVDKYLLFLVYFSTIFFNGNKNYWSLSNVKQFNLTNFKTKCYKCNFSRNTFIVSFPFIYLFILNKCIFSSNDFTLIYLEWFIPNSHHPRLLCQIRIHRLKEPKFNQRWK